MSMLMPIFLIFGVVLLLIIFLFKGSKRFSTNFLNDRKAYMLLGGYIVILLIAVVLFFLDPFPAKSTFDKEVDMDKMMRSYAILNDVVYDGKSIDIFDDYIENKWEFEFKENQFSIQQENDSYMYIIIDEKEEDDGIIEVTTYRTPTIVEGIDITDQLDPVGVTFSSNTLQIMPAYNRFKFVTFEQEFTSKQFSPHESELSEGDFWGMDGAEGYDMEQSYYDRTVHSGEDLLYIRIPKGIKVNESDELYLEYVE